jgi:non-ribosomal peptide synthetase component F
LQQLAQANGATLFMTLSAAFNTFLHRYTGREDLVVASPVANRRSPELESVIGFFVNSLPLRSDASGDPHFVEFVRRTREATLQSYAHQEVPFDKIVESLQPQRDASYHPIFQVMFALQPDLAEASDACGLKWTPFDVDTATAKFDLVLELTETADGLAGWFEYSTDLFEPARVQRLAINFQTLLEGIAAAPSAASRNCRSWRKPNAAWCCTISTPPVSLILPSARSWRCSKSR